MTDNNSQKLALSESFERVAKVAEERAAFNEAMAAKATAALKDSTCPIYAAKLYLQGAGPWKLDEIGISADDYLVRCFARYRDAVIEECAKALEADAKLCDCAALEANECACGAWDDYKSISSARAMEIIRALQEQSK